MYPHENGKMVENPCHGMKLNDKMKLPIGRTWMTPRTLSYVKNTISKSIHCWIVLCTHS
jgi:hypothetical protein